MDNKKNIILIGMMGAGKSTAGHLLDEKLHDFQYIDIDREIEKSVQKNITEIFEQHGEAYFRQIEHETVKKYSNYHNQVISTGGGVVENPENLELLRKNGVIFYLNAAPEELYERVKKTNDRPLLKHENPKHRLKELVLKREPFYKLADFEINTEKKDLLQIVEEILAKYDTVK